MGSKEEPGVDMQLLNKTTDVPNGNAEDGKPDDGDYDPHKHRQLPKATNNFETLVHLLKCSLGTGILAMPQAFARSGLVTGAVGTVLIGILITYCLHLLVDSQYALCKRRKVPLLTYPESVSTALTSGPPMLKPLAKPATAAVDVFLVVYQLGICCVYIVFIGESLKTIVDPYYSMSVELWMLIILLPLIALNCIRDLKLLAPWSSVANLMTFAGLGVILYYLLAGEKSQEPLDLWGSIYTLPLFLGTTLFALTAVGVVIALENNMKTPKAFGKPCGVLNVGMTFIVLLYVLVGCLGYVFCVSKCHDSITLDLPQNDPLATSVKGLFAAAIFISYGLQCYVPVEIVWKTYLLPRLQRSQPSEKKLLMWEYLLRIGLCLLTFVFAVAVPRLGLFISLFGALCLSALGVCYPALMDICIRYPDGFGWLRIRLVRATLIFFAGLVALIIGSYTALLAIVRSFQTEASSVTNSTVH